MPPPPIAVRIATEWLAARARWHPLEVAFWLVAFAAIYLFPDRHLILTEIAWLGLFALSLDLILGYAGIISLGHAAFFGLGAYTAALLAKYEIINEPVLALLVAGFAAMVLGFVTSFLVLRGSDLTRLMVTLGVALVLRELANRYGWLTGGADGLQGVTIKPVLGMFRFDMFGHTGYTYCLSVLFVLFLFARRLVNSPFGLSLMSVKGNPLRSSAIGISVDARLIAIYTVAAGYAGIAGALLAQTTAFASLEVFSFDRSADLLLVLIIGGAGYLYGGLIGAIIFKFMQDYSVGADAAVLAVLDRARSGGDRAGRPRSHHHVDGAFPPPRRPSGLASVGAPHDGLADRGALTMTVVLETIDLAKRFTGIVAANDVSLRIEKGARHALIGPNGAGKTTLINLLTGVLRPTGGRILLDGEDISDLSTHERVRLGIVRTFQINQLFNDLTPLETIGLAVSERRGQGLDWWRVVGSRPDLVTEVVEILERFHLNDVIDKRTAVLPYGKQRLLEIALAIACRPRVLLLDEPAAGVPEDERHEILTAVAELPKDVTVLLIEHDMDIVFSFADRISVLVNGALFVEGSPEEVARDPRVKAVYLGEEVVDV